jgi:choice-of-anchor C domain-containing protein
MGIRVALCASLLSLVLASSARANILVNGALNKDATPLNQYNMVVMTPTLNNTALTGWTITSGSVDILPNSYWQASDGGYSVDLTGTPGIGAIAQTVATTPAIQYTLTFDLAANPEAGPLFETGTTKRLLVEALAANGTTVLASTEYDVTKGANTLQSMGWATNTFTFTATGATSTIRLSALAPGNIPNGATSSTVFCGPAIDNLNLFAGGVPEPTSLSLLGVSASALLLRRRRGR